VSRSQDSIFKRRSGDGAACAISVAVAPALRRGRGQGRTAAGFTLLELLVVVTIIGLLAAYVGPKYFSQLGKSEQGVAKAQVEAFARALDTYRLEVGHYPTTEEGLDALLTKPANAAKLERPVPAESGAARSLGSRLHLPVARRHGDFDITSYGKDGQPGGTGDAADVSLSMSRLAERGCALRFVPYLPTT
jgi:general secretion pathway protein G